MKRKWLILALVGSVLSLPFVMRLRAGTQEQVEVEPVAPREIKASILASGNLEYEEQAQLSPEVLGRVEQVLVREGDKVEPGQVVLRLDAKVYRAQVQQQQALAQQQQIAIEQQRLNIANQERQYKRLKSLFEKKYLAKSQLDDARYALDSAHIELRTRQESLMQAKAQLAQSSEGLAKTDIRAPMAGTVISVDIKVGETAVPSTIGIAGSSLMTVANTHTLISAINVDEADIARVKPGQEVSIHVGAYPDVVIRGRVRTLPLAPARADPRLPQPAGSNSLSRNYLIKASISYPPGLTLRPGMTCRAEIYTSGATHSLAVPIQAVLSNDLEAGTADAEQYVLVDHDGVAAKRVVHTGLSDDTYQEIVSGLKENEHVIVGPYRLLRHLKPGTAVKADTVAKTIAGD